eukprot:g581.t1
MRISVMAFTSLAGAGLAAAPPRKRILTGSFSSFSPYRDLHFSRISSSGPIDANGDPEQEKSEDLNEKTRKLVEENPEVQKAVQRITDAAIKYAEAVQKRENLQHEFLEASKQEIDLQKKVCCFSCFINAVVQEQRVIAEAQQEAAERQMRAAQLRLLAAREEELQLDQLASKFAERIESIKCSVAGCLGGLAVIIPLVLLTADPIEQKLLDLWATIITSSLFAITYRYAIGRGDNTQLKIGVIAAFGVVTSLGYAQSIWDVTDVTMSPLSSIFSSEIAVYSAKSLLHYLASTCAIEFSIQYGYVKLQMDSETKSRKFDE